MELYTILFLIAILLLLFYICLTWNYSYWDRIGLEYLKPKYFYGNTEGLIKQTVSFGDQFANVYKELKSKGCKQGGFYIFFEPIFMPTDLDLIKTMFQKDFAHFANHGVYYNEEADPLSAHLFALEDEKWRKLRAKLSPTFTSGKLKMMYQTMYACSLSLRDVIEDFADTHQPLDMKDIAARFTTDIIASVAFGLECNSLKNPHSTFREKGRKIFDLTFYERCKELIMFMFPKKILVAMKYRFFSEELETFFGGLIKETIRYRERNDIYRKDFMHLLLQLKNRGKVADDRFITLQDGEKAGIDFINFNELLAQCFLFFMAGFETSATTLTFALLELAMNQDVQDKLRDEIQNVLAKYDQELTYEAVMEMKYLEQVILETLRKHPSAPFIPRICTKNFTIPGTDVTIEKGIRVFVSILGIHRDPEIYTDPDLFDPDRFNEENKSKRHPFAFLSFGEGPRYCLGSRYGKLQVKIGLVSILNNYKVHVHEKTQLPIKYVSQRFVLAMKGGVWLTMSKLNK